MSALDNILFEPFGPLILGGYDKFTGKEICNKKLRLEDAAETVTG